MDKIQIYGLIINIFIYFIIIIPIQFLSFFKKIYEKKERFILTLILSSIYFIIISGFLYCFPFKVFSIFTNTSGIINYGVYAFKILFACSSLFALKILIPNYLLYLSHTKKIAILIISKIAMTITTLCIFYLLFNTKGILFTFPLLDFIYSIIYLLLLLNIIRQNI